MIHLLTEAQKESLEKNIKISFQNIHVPTVEEAIISYNLLTAFTQNPTHGAYKMINVFYRRSMSSSLNETVITIPWNSKPSPKDILEMTSIKEILNEKGWIFEYYQCKQFTLNCLMSIPEIVNLQELEEKLKVKKSAFDIGNVKNLYSFL